MLYCYNVTLSEKILHALEYILLVAAGRGLEVRLRRELLHKLSLLGRKRIGDGYVHHNQYVAMAVAVHVGQTLAAQTNAQVKEVFVQEGETVSENARLLRLSDGTSVSGDISGKVWELFVKPGDYVTAGASLAAILDPASFELRIQVDEYDIQSIAVGQTFEVYIPATEENVQATVSHIGKTAVQTGSTTYYEVALTAELSENVLPGMQIEATMTREKIENALLLRMDALQYDTNGRVYAAKEGADGNLSSVATTAFTFRCFPAFRRAIPCGIRTTRPSCR